MHCLKAVIIHLSGRSLDIWPENPHKVNGVVAENMVMEVEQRLQMTAQGISFILSSKETCRCDFEIWFG